MTVYLITIRGTKSGRYKARVETDEGTCIGQAIDHDEAAAVKRASWQAHAWATDHEWGRITIKRRPQ